MSEECTRTAESLSARLHFHLKTPAASPPVRHVFRTSSALGGIAMLQMAIVFLVIGLIAAVLGFGGIAGASFAIAKFLAGLFLVLFLVFLILGLTAAKKIID
jgi:uncharacterized membrane protein YtjA (UPF0391 family)